MVGIGCCLVCFMGRGVLEVVGLVLFDDVFESASIVFV